MTDQATAPDRREHRTRRRLWGLGALTLALICGALLVSRLPPSTGERSAAAAPPLQELRGPPWIYGKPDARFTLIEYADLACEYCRAYFPVLRNWIDQNSHVNWQWHHLPLSMHEPAATQSARLAECAGEAAGTTAFWNTLAWIYAHSPDRQESNALAHLPSAAMPSLTECLASPRPDGVIRSQVDAANREGIAATPTLRLVDNETGTALVLSGPADGDTLLSAIDWLIASPGEDTARMDDGPVVTTP